MPRRRYDGGSWTEIARPVEPDLAAQAGSGPDQPRPVPNRLVQIPGLGGAIQTSATAEKRRTAALSPHGRQVGRLATSGTRMRNDDWRAALSSKMMNSEVNDGQHKQFGAREPLARSAPRR